MKTILLSLALILVAFEAQAQRTQEMNPATVPAFFTTAIRTGASYANSSGDTTSAYNLGGASRLSLVVIAYDSVSLDVYADYRLIGGAGTWTNFLTDSLIGTVDTLNIAEYSIRDNDTDLIDKTNVEIRTREVHRSTGNGTTSATKTSKWVWKP